MSRVVVWFSCGACSAVAAKLTLRQHDPDSVVIAYADPGSEHPDNKRFLGDCARWFNHPIIALRSDKYSDTWQVYAERRFLVGPRGASCTAELKKAVRFDFQRPDDIQVFGYAAGEDSRAERFREQNFDVILETPLISAGLSKSDCLSIIDRAGIKVPAMYLMGYQNNNCIGCPKGGMGYWNKIRRDFPETFARMARVERDLGVRIFDREQIYLDELDPQRGNHADEPNFECSLLCHLAEQDL